MSTFSVKPEHITNEPPWYLHLQSGVFHSLTRDALKRASSVTLLLYDWLVVLHRLMAFEKAELEEVVKRARETPP